MTAPNFKFIDLPTSAEMLGTSRTQLLQWVDEGRIRPFSGKGQQSVFRRGDIEKLGAELGAAAPAVEDEQGAEPDESVAATRPGRAKRRDPVKLIGTRLSMDSRWAEISDEDIATWRDAVESVQFERVRRVAALTIERLQRVVASIDEAASV